jgi:hypothetical protein
MAVDTSDALDAQLLAVKWFDSVPKNMFPGMPILGHHGD